MRKAHGEVFGTVRAGNRATDIMESLGRLDLDNLKGETEETGAESIWFGEVAARARKAARDLKLALDVEKARIADDARRTLTARGERFTVDQIREAVEQDPRHLKAYEAWSQAEYEADLAESAKYALARKHEHLQYLSGLLTQELAARRGGMAAPPPVSKRQPVT